MNRDHLSKMRARKAAKDYMYGANLGAQSDELSDTVLAVKFECHVSTIKRIRERIPVSVLTREDHALIRECAAEKARNDQPLPKFSKAYLTKHYGISVEALDIELDLAGFVNPRTQKKKRRVA